MRSPTFAQIYVVDEDMKKRSERRTGIFSGLDQEIRMTLDMMLAECNPYFLSHGEKIRKDTGEGKETVNLTLYQQTDKRQGGTTKLPPVSEVGVVMVYDRNARDPRAACFAFFETNSIYDSLTYPLLFPMGNHGCTNGEKYPKQHNKGTISLRNHIILKMNPFYTTVDVLTNSGVSTSALKLNKKLCDGIITTKRHSEMIDMPGEAPHVVEEGEFRVAEYNQSERLDDPVTSGRLP
ncbi:LOW QUALITY PROTEIN: Helitron helicase [Phytophthora megakarya]|uniref:Helitron helicase n=1 Tax=Phytophthora megakarya TaxID=4795 RepID=A0A225VZT2_9STRA|nr:LOW QUALITY PROTEIN: Helitron helicase [Phytophthora megakarya]